MSPIPNLPQMIVTQSIKRCAIETAMVLLYRFYCIFVYHVLIILDLYFASWAAVRA